jgi:hypothetical protein
VWVNQAEIAELASATGHADIAEFERLYVRKIGIRHSLVEFPNGDCVFFDSGKRSCTVYDARPRQCRTWPFWKSNLRSEADWKRTCEQCPGSGKGKLYSLAQIQQTAAAIEI